MKIEIYGRPNCSWCDSAKNLLKRHNIEFNYHDIEESEVARSVVRDLGARTVPVIFIEGKWIGGYKDLQAYLPTIVDL